MPKHKAEDFNEEEILDEQNQEGETDAEADLNEKILSAFSNAHNDGKEEDEVKLAMIGAGATFKNVTRLYNQFMVDSGLAVSKEEKDQILTSVLSGADLSDEATFNSKVAELMASMSGTNDKSAAALIRAYAKKNGLESFKKAKGSVGESKQGFAGAFYAWLIANPTSTVAEATAFVNGVDGNPETSENVKRHLSHYLGIHNLVNRVAGVEAVVE